MCHHYNKEGGDINGKGTKVDDRRGVWRSHPCYEHEVHGAVERTSSDPQEKD